MLAEQRTVLPSTVAPRCAARHGSLAGREELVLLTGKRLPSRPLPAQNPVRDLARGRDGARRLAGRARGRASDGGGEEAGRWW